MKKLALAAAIAASIAFPAAAQKEAKETFTSPNEIVDKAPAKDWVTIAESDLLVMDLAPDRDGKARRVVIQLMPAPFSQGWIGNIRKLAAAKWWDGTSVNRVQDNYVVQWGDATEKKALPDGLKVMEEREYEVVKPTKMMKSKIARFFDWGENHEAGTIFSQYKAGSVVLHGGSYSFLNLFEQGFPISMQLEQHFKQSSAPVHCYGMVGVGRGYSPDTGSGAELYTVIGHAPRHLDRNIALVGRVIEGIEHLSSLPRGTGPLGFYEKAEQRVPITSVRIQSRMPTDKPLPSYEYLSTESGAFARYADARANRRDPFFIKPAGGADICNIPVPVRRKK